MSSNPAARFERVEPSLDELLNVAWSSSGQSIREFFSGLPAGTISDENRVLTLE